MLVAWKMSIDHINLITESTKSHSHFLSRSSTALPSISAYAVYIFAQLSLYSSLATESKGN